MMSFYVLIFLACCVLLYFSGEWVVGGLMRMARFLGWREFVVAFFVMAFAASLPNLFIGITSALHKIPQLSFGDVAGNNLVALTIAIALAVLISKKELPAESRTVQTTSIFTIIAALLPLLLILDGKLSRIDGILLIAFFIFYLFWLFSKRERFTKIYDTQKIPIIKEFKLFLKDLGKLILGIMLLIIAAQGIVASAQFFAKSFDITLVLIGVLITGLGSALPEIYFAVASAKRGETWMILGDLMGAVIVPATLVLGIVALIHPIEISDFSPLAIARFFLIISALFFLFFVRTDRKITKKEALFLLSIYLIFVLVEILAG
ncbi:MAG: hypothetical protein CO146_02920 [Candidatus Nealsonbacteria bacterium CG_4_9_14_3_um_filter_37_29]|uniref:Sodium/calcium exchanger membrane region domain-containing protein n=1 Tax=Candidatus Nealsonbacteria bacterium CG_4_9_14_3_um_filter_37_29 TaxID=1974696 RepID=A0A2M7Z2Q6_9BACT|nr:MAG: hypothetical protein CO146_02920 [Candidatus Nealsonbacteria bacterium CG_4_9_14_3_um_filter_37_29]